MNIRCGRIVHAWCMVFIIEMKETYRLLNLLKKMQDTANEEVQLTKTLPHQ